MESNTQYFWSYCKLTMPIFVYYFCFFIQSNINIAMISKRYEDNNLVNGIGIANLYLNCTTFSILIGLTTGVETLSSNAVGNKDYYLAGIYASRGKYILLTLLTGLAVLHFFFARIIFEFFGIVPEVMEQTLKYLWCVVPSYYIASFNIINSRIVSILGYSIINTAAGVASVATQPFVSYFLIFKLDMGVVGAGLAQNFTFFVLFVVYSGWIEFLCPYKEVNSSFFDPNIRRDFSRYLEVAVPNTLLMIAKWWAAEIQAIFAILMSPSDYTVYIITYAFHLVLVSYTLSCAIGNVIFIGKVFGDEKRKGIEILPILKRNQSFLACTLGVIIVVVWLCRYQIAVLYTNDQAVIEKIAGCLYLVMIHVLLDGFNENFETTSKAINDQKIPAGVGISVYYLVQCAGSYYLGVKMGLGVTGIWFGFIAASFCMNMFFLVFIGTRDLECLKKKSLEALKKNQAELTRLLEEEAVECRKLSNLEEHRNYTKLPENEETEPTGRNSIQ